MKKNLQRCNYDATPSENGNWWKFSEFCDICKKPIFEGIMMGKEPDIEEDDLCIDCMHKLLDEKISIRGNIKTFTVEIDNKNVTAFSNIPGSYIQPGDYYIGKRNTGWHLGKCKEVKDGYIVSENEYKIYYYNIGECRLVKSIENI